MLNSRYMGLELAHPIIAASSPLSQSVDGMRRLEDGGVSAVVMFTLFEDEIPSKTIDKTKRLLPLHCGPKPEEYFHLIEHGTHALSIPIIASLCCSTQDGWADLAKSAETAGASAIELNIYEIDIDDEHKNTSQQYYSECLELLKKTVSIPVSIKLSPYFSQLGTLAKKLDSSGADGLVLFNRYYQPDFDIEALTAFPTLSLSTSEEMRHPLRWISLLYGQIKTNIAGVTGVETSVEVIKYLLAGADTVMVASALLRRGPAYAGQLVNGLAHWMERHEFKSINDFKGKLSHGKLPDKTPLEKANYIKALEYF